MDSVSLNVRNVLSFEPPTRMPCVEWCMWWDQTLALWEEQGMPSGMDDFALYDYFGLDKNVQFWLDHYSKECPKPTHQSRGLIDGEADYDMIRAHILREDAVSSITERLQNTADQQRNGEAVAWYTVNGFFWLPRELFGVENHLYSFYDHASLYHRICEDLLAWQMKRVDELNMHLNFEFMTIAEDMSYNLGPMISRTMFDTFIAPYYKKLIPHIQKYGTKVFVDTDGDVTKMIPWLLDCGVEGVFPLERKAGVDVVGLRKEYPELLMIGGFDKRCILQGKEAITAEIKYLRPVAQSGGFIPGMDHQTPPGTTLGNYKFFIDQFKTLL